MMPSASQNRKQLLHNAFPNFKCVIPCLNALTDNGKIHIIALCWELFRLRYITDAIQHSLGAVKNFFRNQNGRKIILKKRNAARHIRHLNEDEGYRSFPTFQGICLPLEPKTLPIIPVLICFVLHILLNMPNLNYQKFLMVLVWPVRHIKNYISWARRYVRNCGIY